MKPASRKRRPLHANRYADSVILFAGSGFLFPPVILTIAVTMTEVRAGKTVFGVV